MEATFPNTPAGMKAAQRAFDAQEHPDYFCPPRRRRNRSITLPDGTEISEADVDDRSSAEVEEDE